MINRRPNLVKMGRSPLKNIGIGAGIGAGAGVLIDWLLNNKEREGDNYNFFKRPLLFALLGTLPGLIHGGYQYKWSSKPKEDSYLPSLDKSIKWSDPLTKDGDELMKLSPQYKDNILAMTIKDRFAKGSVADNLPIVTALDDQLNKEAALGFTIPTIPAPFVTNSVYNNAGCVIGAQRNNIPNAMTATVNRVGSNLVSPFQVATTLVNAGVGGATSAVIGKTIGALCGISPQSYNTLKQTGIYAGMMNQMNNAIQRY